MPGKKRCPACDQDVTVNPSGTLRKHHDLERNGYVCDGLPRSTRCPGCGKTLTVNPDLTTPIHTRGDGEICDGAPPVSEVAATVEPMTTHTNKGPWFIASYGGECSTCFRTTEKGDEIRADGEGGWECLDPCGEREAVEALGSEELDPLADVNALLSSRSSAATAGDLDAVNALLADPSAADGSRPAEKDKTGRSGYYVTDPETGLFQRYKNGNIKGFTRCTTLVKAASDTATLTDWKQRNTLLGAAKRPDIAMKAHGLTHEDDKAALNRLVDELDTIAGAKVASGHGQEIHSAFEGIADGTMTLDDVDPKWRNLTELYLAEMERYGLEACPGLVEQTTMTHLYGGVAGRFDEIRYHRPSRTYVMCDTKSGQHVANYGRNEVPAQLAVYAEGFNKYGVYDWPEPPEDPDAEWPPGRWRRPVDAEGRLIQVRTDVGCVIHTPIQGKDAYTVTLRWPSLVWGRYMAKECAQVRKDRSSAPKWVTASPEEIEAMLVTPAALVLAEDMAEDAVPVTPTWADPWPARFQAVKTRDEANALYVRARDAGLPVEDLAKLIRIGKAALLSTVDTPAQGA